MYLIVRYLFNIYMQLRLSFFLDLLEMSSIWTWLVASDTSTWLQKCERELTSHHMGRWADCDQHYHSIFKKNKSISQPISQSNK